jgi:protein-disulfide isomerase
VPKNSSGAPLVVASLILAASILGAAFLVQSSLDRAATQLGDVLTALQKIGAAAPAPTPARPARPGRPDPNKRYEVDISGSPSTGNSDARVTVVEFSDFQCPYCARVGPTLKKVQEEYGEDVNVVFKHLPLGIHPKAPAAHAAAEAAHRQGRFWEMHDLIFANQREMSPKLYEEYAQQLGLDVERFRADVASSEVRKRVSADASEAGRLGVTGTPAFFINGRFLSGAQPYPSFQRLIDEELRAGG